MRLSGAASPRTPTSIPSPLPSLAHPSWQVWNGMFSQTQHALDRGMALQLDSDRYTAMAKYYSLRSQQVAGSAVWLGRSL